MFIKNFYGIYFIFLVFGSLVSVSANSWFLAWLGFEINVLNFIPLVLIRLNFNFTETAIKYFIVQAFASVLLLTFSLLRMQEASFLFLDFNTPIIFIALALKIGAAPLHLWFPQTTKNIKWGPIFILLTWQKIAPLFLMAAFSRVICVTFFATISAVIGSFRGVNQTNFKLILTFSSIVHRGWLILLASTSSLLTFLYFLIYASTLAFIVWSLSTFKKKRIKGINASTLGPRKKFLFSINIMSLGGLPPFLGFTAKILSLILLIKFLPLPILLILILTSVITLIFYLKMFFPALPLKNFFLKTPPSNFLHFTKIRTLFFLILVTNLTFSLLILLT